MKQNIQPKNKCKLFSLKYLFFDFVKVTAIVPGMIWYRPKILYENEQAKKKIRGGALLVSNHCGYDDIICLQFGVWYRRHHFIAAQELFGTAVTNVLFNWFLCIPINRSNMNFGTFRVITSHLQNGELVTMFPEGHINHSTEMEQFKSGAILMSLKSKRPIIPIYLKRRKHFYNRKIIVIGQPIDICATLNAVPSLADMDNAAQLLKDKELQLGKIAEQF